MLLLSRSDSSAISQWKRLKLLHFMRLIRKFAPKISDLLLIRRLIAGAVYHDGGCNVSDSFRAPGIDSPTQSMLSLTWAGLKSDYEQVSRTYQYPVITEFATLGLACILVAERAGLEITEVTRRGDRADYWLGDREFLLEVSGQQAGKSSRPSKENPGLEARTLFEWLQREYPGRTRTGRLGPWSGESSRAAALTAICSRCLLFGSSELISH